MRSVDLARALGLSKGRISQLVADGTLAGCYSGEGRRRTFDPERVAARLGRPIGAAAPAAAPAAAEAAAPPPADPSVPAPRTPPPPAEPGLDRYLEARILKAEEEARRLTRQNAADDGRFVLAAAVARETRRQLAAERAGFQAMLEAGAAAVAAELGLEAARVQAILEAMWRQARAGRPQPAPPAAAPDASERRETS